MGHSHSHGQALPAPRIGRLPRVFLVAFLAVVAALTVWGVVTLWPHGDPKVAGAAAGVGAQYAAPGVTFPRADVVGMTPPCPVSTADQTGMDDTAPPSDSTSGSTSGSTPGSAAGSTAGSGPGSGLDSSLASGLDSGVGPLVPPGSCGQLTVRLASGPDAGKQLAIYAPTQALTVLKPGNRVELMKVPVPPGTPAAGALTDAARNGYSFVGIERGTPLWVLLAVFVLLVVVVARWRGLGALLGLLIAGAVILEFMLPSLLRGHSALAVAVVGSVAIMFLVLYLAHGVSMRTSAALAGTIFGIAATAGIGELAVQATHLTGVGDENAGYLQAFVGNVNLQGLLSCGIVIAGLGVLNDVTITQASAIWELRAAGATSGLRDLFTRGMRIGRDHLASTVYTIVFAYVGTAIPLMLLLSIYQQPIGDLLTSEDLTAEIVRTLASAIGLVLAIPLTTLVAVAVIGPGPGRRTSHEDASGREQADRDPVRGSSLEPAVTIRH